MTVERIQLDAQGNPTDADMTSQMRAIVESPIASITYRDVNAERAAQRAERVQFNADADYVNRTADMQRQVDTANAFATKATAAFEKAQAAHEKGDVGQAERWAREASRFEALAAFTVEQIADLAALNGELDATRVSPAEDTISNLQHELALLEKTLGRKL